MNVTPQPLVSVVLPTHNRAELLVRSVRSVLAQSYTNLELLVVDDASSDDTPAALAQVVDTRLRVIRQAQNQGAGAARNAGIAAARGTLIAFQDDDDVWFVHKLQRQVEALLEAPEHTGWCLCGFVRYSGPDCRYIGGPGHYREIDFSQGANRTLADGGQDWSLIATPGWLIKRAVLERAGVFDERIRSWDDWELGLRIDRVCARVFVDEPLFLQDLARGGGLTRAERARASDLRIIMDKHGAMWSRMVQARHWFLIGWIESKHDDPPAGRDALLRALRLRPASAPTWLALLLSFAGRRGNHFLSRLFQPFARLRRELAAARLHRHRP